MYIYAQAITCYLNIVFIWLNIPLLLVSYSLRSWYSERPINLAPWSLGNINISICCCGTRDSQIHVTHNFSWLNPGYITAFVEKIQLHYVSNKYILECLDPNSTYSGLGSESLCGVIVMSRESEIKWTAFGL